MRLLKDYSEGVARYESGDTLAAIAADYGVTKVAVRAGLIRRGVVMRPRGGSGGEASNLYRGGPAAPACLNERESVSRAIRAGRLVPQPCEVCGFAGTTKDGRRGVIAHHDDYTEPLEVRWLCHRCHHEWHRRHQAIDKNGEVMAVKTNRLKATPVLRERIREVGLRQNWLADRVGVSEATLSLVIAGKRGLTQQRAWQLAALVDNDVALLFELSKDGRKLSKSSRRA